MADVYSSLVTATINRSSAYSFGSINNMTVNEGASNAVTQALTPVQGNPLVSDYSSLAVNFYSASTAVPGTTSAVAGTTQLGSGSTQTLASIVSVSESSGTITITVDASGISGLTGNAAIYFALFITQPAPIENDLPAP